MSDLFDEDINEGDLKALAESWKENRRRLKKEYGRLYSVVSEILFRNDPIGINFEDNTDEYEPEAETILPRLRECSSVQDVRRVVHEEFIRWFSSDQAGPEESYNAIAEEIWREWKSEK